MAHVHEEEVVGTSARPRALVALGLAVALAAGCVTPKDLLAPEELALKAPPCHLVIRWINEVATAPDPARGGVPGPGLVGRVYLFGPKIDCPLDGDGALTVELYNRGAPGSKPLERWNFPAAELERLKRPDAIGPGYSLFLPWGTYRPEITHVELRACYYPKKGSPVYSNSGTLVLGADALGAPAAMTARPEAGPTTRVAAKLPGPPAPVAPAGPPQLTPATKPPEAPPLKLGAGSPALTPGLRGGGGIVIDKGLGPWTK